MKHKKSVVEKWIGIVEEFERSGLKPSVYCRRNSISVKTLYTWRSRFNRINTISSTSEEQFLELKLKEAANSKSDISELNSISVVFNNKFKIVIENEFNESLLLKTIKVLDRALC